MSQCQFLLKHFLQSCDFLVPGPPLASARPPMETVEVRSVQSVPLFDWEAVPVLHGWRVVCLCRVSGCRRRGSQGFDFCLVFYRHPAWPAFRHALDVRGSRKRPLLKAKLTSTRLVGCINSVFAWMQKKDVKLKTTVVEIHLYPRRNQPVGFCYPGCLGNSASCWVGCFYGFNESDWKRHWRFILVSGPAQRKTWFLKNRNDSPMLVSVLQDLCRYFNFNILFDDNLKCPFVCDLYYMIHLIL